MPTAERRPRARLRSRGVSDIQDMEELRGVLAAVHGDDEAWPLVRGRVTRFLAQRVKDSERALRIAEAFHRRPDLLPMPAPTAVRD